MFKKSKLIPAQAIRSRGYTGETHLRGFGRVCVGGVCLCALPESIALPENPLKVAEAGASFNITLAD